jgi:Tfp pilus assembly protein PilV
MSAGATPRRRVAGFTIVEGMVAKVVLSVGVLALVGSSGMVTRMIGRGKGSTRAAQTAVRRFEILRQLSTSTATPCTSPSLVSGGPVKTVESGNTITESWTVTPNGNLRDITVTVSYPTARGTIHTDVLRSRILC